MSISENTAVLQRWVCVLLRGGGFRPCIIERVRPSLGSEIHERIVEMKPAFMSAAVACAEAEEWAELNGETYRPWPGTARRKETA
jgi:hypothetical protein